MIATAPHWLEADNTTLKSNCRTAAPSPAETKAKRRDDLTFARRVMDGWPGEISRFLNEFRPAVQAYLMKLSWDARSREEATNAVDDVFSECFGGFAGKGRNGKKRVPLLQRYEGFGSLEGWLKRSARNRFYSALRRSEYRQRAAGVQPEADWVDAVTVDPGTTTSRGDRDLDGHSSEYPVTCDERERIREAIAAAFQSLANFDSQALIFLRLHFLEKVKKQRIAAAWDQHPATVGRRINSGLEHLREQLAQRLPDYTDANSTSSSQATESLILLCRDLLDTCVD